ncbi:hypothetical protein Areg01_41880 [Actinoplanes regularis]|nr:hypothetical protein Areg01_41880 [Actinoplanes regularis]
MFAEKLSRLVGLVLVLAVLTGGATAGGVGRTAASETTAVQASTLEFVWT